MVLSGVVQVIAVVDQLAIFQVGGTLHREESALFADLQQLSFASVGKPCPNSLNCTDWTNAALGKAMRQRATYACGCARDERIRQSVNCRHLLFIYRVYGHNAR